jgi:hypothetical protein
VLAAAERKRKVNRLTLLLVASTGALFTSAPSPALGTPDRSTTEATRSGEAGRLGWPAPRALAGAERVERGKRCATCPGTSANPGRATEGVELAVPEPAGALLFGLGVLAIRARARRRG